LGEINPNVQNRGLSRKKKSQGGKRIDLGGHRRGRPKDDGRAFEMQGGSKRRLKAKSSAEASIREEGG